MPKESGQRSLVIVESPTKARTIERFLGKEYVVKASNGHIRDLPQSQSEVPLKYKTAAWKDLGVDVDNDFWPLYVVPASKKQQVKELKDLVKTAKEIYLATDEDREGESISWHLLETLKPTAPIKRLVFHEITKEAIQHALATPRDIDLSLVEAQETRRIVDRLFGYRVSPLLWKKMARGLSAGRVQSVAVRLLVERERDRIKFHSASYWGLKATFAKNGETFETELTHVGDRRVAMSRDFDPDTGLLLEKEGLFTLSGSEAEKLRAEVLTAQAKVASVEQKPFTRSPAAPYVTSTLQQDGNRKLRLSARRTMTIAQQLYENGFITYMRTDSTTLSTEALEGARKYIASNFGADYQLPAPRQYQTKVKNAQEAHEAIRPAGEDFADAARVRQQLGPEAGKVYEMILRRTLASQMPDARGTNIVVMVDAGSGRFRAAGKTVEFPGFLRAYLAGEDLTVELGGHEKVLPAMAPGDLLKTGGVDAQERHTQPPSRYTEGALIRELERLGIGRPSTWATIVDLVLSRSYAFKKGTALVPTFTAMAVVGLLEKHFTNVVDYAFTARLEDDLDAISRGEADRNGYLRGFYFGNGHPGLKTLVEKGEEAIDPREVCGLPIGTTEDGQEIEVRIGRYGPFLSMGELRAGVPDETPPDRLTVAAAVEMLEAAAKGPEALGQDPETGKPVFLKAGRFGPYVQLGEAEEGVKPKMASLLPGMAEAEVDLALALRLLSLPRVIGAHPETGEEVLAANGRFGPFVKSGDEIRSIPPGEASPLDITLEKAVEILKQPKGRRGRAAPAAPLKELGPHPGTDKQLKILAGRFGPYVTDGEINASVPRGTAPEDVSVEQAVALLEARAIRIAEGGGKRPVRKKAAKKKATKATARKRATKKAKKASKKE